MNDPSERTESPRPRRGRRRLLDGDWVRSRRDAGQSAAQIAAEAGCKPGTVYLAMRRHGIPPPRGDADRLALLDDPDWLRRRYHADGKSLRSIARELGSSSSHVLRKLAQHGIQRRPDGGGSPGLWNQGWLRKRYATQGASVEDIARELGCPPQAVRKRLKRLGYRLPVAPDVPTAETLSPPTSGAQEPGVANDDLPSHRNGAPSPHANPKEESMNPLPHDDKTRLPGDAAHLSLVTEVADRLSLNDPGTPYIAAHKLRPPASPDAEAAVGPEVDEAAVGPEVDPEAGTEVERITVLAPYPHSPTNEPWGREESGDYDWRGVKITRKQASRSYPIYLEFGYVASGKLHEAIAERDGYYRKMLDTIIAGMRPTAGETLDIDWSCRHAMTRQEFHCLLERHVPELLSKRGYVIFSSCNVTSTCTNSRAFAVAKMWSEQAKCYVIPAPLRCCARSLVGRYLQWLRLGDQIVMIDAHGKDIDHSNPQGLSPAAFRLFVPGQDRKHQEQTKEREAARTKPKRQKSDAPRSARKAAAPVESVELVASVTPAAAVELVAAAAAGNERDTLAAIFGLHRFAAARCPTNGEALTTRVTPPILDGVARSPYCLTGPGESLMALRDGRLVCLYRGDDAAGRCLIQRVADAVEEDDRLAAHAKLTAGVVRSKARWEQLHDVTAALRELWPAELRDTEPVKAITAAMKARLSGRDFDPRDVRKRMEDANLAEPHTPEVIAHNLDLLMKVMWQTPAAAARGLVG